MGVDQPVVTEVLVQHRAPSAHSRGQGCPCSQVTRQLRSLKRALTGLAKVHGVCTNAAVFPRSSGLASGSSGSGAGTQTRWRAASVQTPAAQCQVSSSSSQWFAKSSQWCEWNQMFCESGERERYPVLHPLRSVTVYWTLFRFSVVCVLKMLP